MIIKRSPVFSDETLTATRSGDTLNLNGTSFDFTDLAEGDILPADAVNSQSVISDVTRKGGEINTTIRWPHTIDADEADRFPEPFTPDDGPTGQAGQIDWLQLKTASDLQSKELEQERQGMKCSRLQGRLVLGEATCDMLDAMAADPETPWAMKQAILHAIEWSRTSQSMNELAWLLGYTDDQMDALFRQAATVTV